MSSAAVRFDRGSPTIAITNRSRVEDREVRRVVAAVQKQVDLDFFPLWGWRAKLHFGPNPAPKGAMRLILKGRHGEGDLGYHFIQGVPVTHVFTVGADGEPIEDWTSTFSHEVLEMIADPGVNLYALGHYRTRSGKKRNAFIAYEVCDPVQENLYEIDGVRVGDFVTPEWFEPERRRRSVKFSFKDSVHQPFALADGGYIDAMVGSRMITAWGKAARRKRRRHRHNVRAVQIG